MAKFSGENYVLRKFVLLLCVSVASLLFSSCAQWNRVSRFVEKTLESDESKERRELKALKQHMAQHLGRFKEIRDLAIATRKKPQLSEKLKSYCQKIDKKFHHYKWGESDCQKFDWLHVRNSHLGNPIMWVVYGNEKEHKIKHKNSTMIFCGVHGDEITPIKFCFDIIHYLDDLYHSPETHHLFDDRLVVVAPIVTPDAFFVSKPTRTNYRGVDINRNFPTDDWEDKALKVWKRRYGKDERRYPGEKPLSEQETIFQVNLINRYDPDKIISVHAPLTILDYDGPEIVLKNDEDAAENLLTKMSKNAENYNVKDYPFFPGSLGNWAGNERGIPTYTLELPSSDNRKHDQYWNRFRKAIYSAFMHSMKPVNVADQDRDDDDSESAL